MTTLIHTRRRRGAFYFFALFLAMLVSTLLLGLSAFVATGRHTLRNLARSDQALLAARAGVEHVLGMANEDPNWRANRTSGVWLTDRPFAGATYSVTVLDDDGNLVDDSDDDVVITAIGIYENSSRTVRVRARPVAINALNTSVTVSTAFTLVDATATVDAGIYSNNRISADDDSTINGNLFATGSIDLGRAQLNGSALTPVRPRELPPPEVFDWYAAQATPIPHELLPKVPGKISLLKRVVLSPALNPYGPANPRGIYLIDLTNSRNLQIEDCRIDGTLIVRNSLDFVRLRGGLVARSAHANYPVLLFDLGNDFADSKLDSQLSEITTNTNFNPPGPPEPTGTDSVADDVYSTTIDGIFVVYGDFRIARWFRIRGSLIQVGSELYARTDGSIWFDVDQSPWLAEHPPPRFRSHRLRLVPGTWRLVTPAP